MLKDRGIVIMRRLLKYILIASTLAVLGCGDSFNHAQDYLTGPVNGVGLKSSTSVVSGGTEQLFPVVSPPKTSNKSVTWSSSDSSIVSVDSNGVITGVATPAHGTTETTVITVTTDEGGYTAQCTVTVSEKPVAVTGVTLSSSATAIQLGGVQLQLTATVIPSDATNQNLAWTSSNSNVIVDGSGRVMAAAAGTAIVTVTTVDGGYKASCTVTVTTEPVYYVTYNSNGASGGAVPTDSTGYVEGSAVTVKSSNTLVKTSYNFGGWNTIADGTGDSYAAGSTLTINSASVTLYAQWTTNPTYTVTYAGNGSSSGTIPTDGNTYQAGDSVTVPGQGSMLGPIINEGITQTFISWNTRPDGTGTNYTSGSVFSISPADVILYAKWTTDSSVIRKPGPAGGLVFYDKGSYTSDGNGIWRYLEAAPADQSNSAWSNITGTLIGTTGTAIGTGKTNTAAIIGQSGHTASAALVCENYSIGGYTDWFLPSQDEMNAMYTNLAAYGVGGFTTLYYWNSSETGDRSYAFTQLFSNGNQPSYLKAAIHRVRAIRAF